MEKDQQAVETPPAVETPQAVEKPQEKEAAPPTRTLLSYVEELHLIVERAKLDGVRPIQLLLGVGGRQGLSAWDVFLTTFDPGSAKAAKK